MELNKVIKPLTLDLGTTTGFAVGTRDNMISGTWNLKPSRFDGGGMRFVKFRARLDETYRAVGFTMVFYEEVRNHKGVDAAHVYGGLLATLTAWCEENGVPYEGVGVGTIKKHWTGKGNANKQAMIAECERRGFSPKDDNEADAVALFDLMLHRFHADTEDIGIPPPAASEEYA